MSPSVQPISRRSEAGRYKRRMRSLPLILLAAVVLSAFAPAAQAAGGSADGILVLRKGGLTSDERSHAGVVKEQRLRIAGVELVRARGERAQALAALRADPDVEWAEPNRRRRVSAEPLFGFQWNLANTGQVVDRRAGTPDADIDAPEAWAISRGAGVTVAVIDTGVDAGHPDLAGRLVTGHDYVEGDPDPNDENGHGTHVTGTIAAGLNGLGIAGVAPEANIMPLRVLDDEGSGYAADVASAFDYAGDLGVRVVNASLGSTERSQAELLAIQSHPGTLFVVAAGNGGGDGIGDDNDGTATEYPCAYAEPNVICVGASGADDTRSGFSNFGATTVDLFAPGVQIVSTVRGGGHGPEHGTSMATPHASGAAALALAELPAWSTAQLKSALINGVDRRAGLADLSVGGGRLNAATTVGIAARSHVAPVPAPQPARAALSPTPTAVPVAVAPRLSGLRIRVRSRKRAATLYFQLAAEASVKLHLQRRRCSRERCRWRLVGTRIRRLPAGPARWTIGPPQGLRLARGTWRVRLATPAGTVQRRFTVR